MIGPTNHCSITTTYANGEISTYQIWKSPEVVACTLPVLNETLWFNNKYHCRVKHNHACFNAFFIGVQRITCWIVASPLPHLVNGRKLMLTAFTLRPKSWRMSCWRCMSMWCKHKQISNNNIEWCWWIIILLLLNPRLLRNALQSSRKNIRIYIYYIISCHKYIQIYIYLSYQRIIFDCAREQLVRRVFWCQRLILWEQLLYCLLATRICHQEYIALEAHWDPKVVMRGSVGLAMPNVSEKFCLPKFQHWKNTFSSKTFKNFVQHAILCCVSTRSSLCFSLWRASCTMWNMFMKIPA